MKKRLKFGLLLLVVMTVGIYFVVENRNQTKFADLVFNNVDALANGEDDIVGIECLEDGSLNCLGFRAKYMIELRSLRK